MSKELETFRKIVKGFTETFNMAIHHPKDTIVKWEGVEEIENSLKAIEQYHKIEEEIGIDLITLFKLIKSKKIYSFSNNGIANNDINGVNIYTNTITIWNGVCKVEYPLSEYGKSFALTKEELL